MSLLGTEILEKAPQALPFVQLNLLEQMSFSLSDAIDNDEVDVALVSNPPASKTIASIPLLTEELLLISSGSESDGVSEIDFDKVINLPLVLGGPRASVRMTLEAEAKRRKKELKIEKEISSVSITKRLVMQGGISTIMPVTTVLNELRVGQLQVARISDAALSRTTCIVHSARRNPTRGEESTIKFLQSLVPAVVRNFGSLAVGVLYSE